MNPLFGKCFNDDGDDYEDLSFIISLDEDIISSV